MRRLFLFILFILLAGCGGGYSPYGGSASISVMEISILHEPLKTGTTVPLSINVTLNTGEVVNGLTTSFVDTTSGEELPITWSTSDKKIAFVDEKANLVLRTPGYITVSAELAENVRTRTVRVDGTPRPSISPVPDADASEEDNIEDDGTEVSSDLSGGGDDNDTAPPAEETPVTCQGYAVSVVSFSPGDGDGFGSSSFPEIVLGPPIGAGNIRGSTDVLSLGSGGEIVLDLGRCRVVDGDGIDLIVFENSFFVSGNPETPYAELSEVSVSEDGSMFAQFPCNSDGFPYTGCAGWNPVYSSPSNGISPFDTVNAGGEKFDLADIGIESARYVKIRDLGTAGFGTSVGFDLDAIAVINGVRH